MNNTKTNWFEVDKEGLKKITNRYGCRSFLVYELVQNAWDEASQNVDICFSNLNQTGKEPSIAELIVRDDNPEGFKNLQHAYVLFAESDKKSDPSKRGRFNLGEKLVIANCFDAQISTTKGTVRFDKDGTRSISESKTKRGSIFTGRIEMEAEEFAQIRKAIQLLIPPKHIRTFLDARELKRNEADKVFIATLATEIADENGTLRPTERKCQIEIYKAPLDRKALIYEMGIPVVEYDGSFDINVMQKVPLNIDRTNVTPGYLRKLRTVVLNESFKIIDKEDASSTWVRDALEDKNINSEAVRQVLNLQYGDKKVTYDLSDSEANKLAISEGYTVLHGGAFSKNQWENIRKAEAILPAGKVTPSPKPYSPNGNPLKIIPKEKWTFQEQQVVAFMQMLSRVLINRNVPVIIANDKNLQANATYGPGSTLVLNIQALGYNFFNEFPNNIDRVISLGIHEFAHEICSDHLDAKYHRTICDFGGKIAKDVGQYPKVWHKYIEEKKE